MQATAEILKFGDIERMMNERRDNAEIKINETIAQMKDLQNKTNEKVKELRNMLPSLIKAIEKQGLAITEFHYNKSGDEKAWSEGDQMSVDVTAVPTSGKFRFIKFDGYTAKGAGRNQSRLEAKADALAQAIKKETNFKGVYVNRFSLEIKNDSDSKSVLIGVWI